MQLLTVVLLAVLNVPVYLAAGRWVFGDWAGFRGAASLWARADFFTVRGPDFLASAFEEMKMAVFLLICLFSVFTEYRLLQILLE